MTDVAAIDSDNSLLEDTSLLADGSLLEVEEQSDSQPQLPLAPSKQQGLVTLSAQEPPQLTVNHQKAEPLTQLLEFLALQAQTATPVLIVAETAGRREILIELFKGKIDIKAYDSFAGVFSSGQDQQC